MSTHANNCRGDVFVQHGIPTTFAYRATCGAYRDGFKHSSEAWRALAIHEPLTLPCPRCAKFGPDSFGDQEPTTGWHMGCAADFAHEQQRDRDPHYHRSEG